MKLFRKKKKKLNFKNFEIRDFFSFLFIVQIFVFNCINVLIIVSVKIVSLWTIDCISIAFVSLFNKYKLNKKYFKMIKIVKLLFFNINYGFK